MCPPSCGSGGAARDTLGTGSAEGACAEAAGTGEGGVAGGHIECGRKSRGPRAPGPPWLPVSVTVPAAPGARGGKGRRKARPGGCDRAGVRYPFFTHPPVRAH